MSVQQKLKSLLSPSRINFNTFKNKYLLID